MLKNTPEKLELQKEIGQRLQQARKMANLSQEQMAYKMGVLQSNVSQYEVGRTMPRLKVLVGYATECKVHPIWILTGDGEPYPHVYQVGQQPLPYFAELAYKHSNIIDVSYLALSGRFRALRKMLRISQHQFADSLPYSRTTVSYWESGRCVPRVDHIIDVAERVKCNVWWLAFGIGVAWPQK